MMQSKVQEPAAPKPLGINEIIDKAIKSLLHWPGNAISVQSLLQTLIIERALFSQSPSFPLGNLDVKRPINVGNLLCGKAELRPKLSLCLTWSQSPGMASQNCCSLFIHT